MKPELRALTSMRGIAAWFVVLYHIRLSVAGLPDAVVAVLAKGYLAVDFFFLLSGFVIWLAWHDRLRTGGLSRVPAFLLKRIARIWPLHLFLLGAAGCRQRSYRSTHFCCTAGASPATLCGTCRAGRSASNWPPISHSGRWCWRSTGGGCRPAYW